MLLFLTFYSSLNPEKSITGYKKVLSTDNNGVSNIMMTSEGSYNTEDWSNG